MSGFWVVYKSLLIGDLFDDRVLVGLFIDEIVLCNMSIVFEEVKV